MTHAKTFQKVGVASFIMMASVFASRLIGAFREIAIAGTNGIQAGVDAYQIAFVLPEILNHVVASGFLSITFIPIFTRYLQQDDEETGWKVFSMIHNVFGLLLLVLVIVSVIYAPLLVSLTAPGIKDPQTFAMAVRMTRIILPAQLFFFSGGLLMAVQFAKENFFIPALAPLFYNLGIIVFGLALGPYIGMEGFAWGVLFGSFIGNFLIQIIGFKKVGGRFGLNFNLKHPDLIQYIKVTLPLAAGLTMTFSTEIQFKFFGSYLEQGTIASLNYGLRVMFIIVGIFGQAVGVAAYPYMAKLAVSGKMAELNHLLNQTLKYMTLIIPVSVLFAVLSHEIILILFQRGAFDARATQFTAGILPFFMAGSVAFCAQTIVSRGFYAKQNTLFPAIVATICVAVGLVPIYFLIQSYGAKGLALGISISVMIQIVALFESWSIKNNNTGRSSVYAFFVKILVISGGIGLITYGSAQGLRQVFSQESFTGCLAISTLTGLIFVLIFYAAGRIFSINEITMLFNRIVQRFSRS